MLLFVLLSFMTSACSLYTINSEDTTTEFYPPKNSPNDVVVLDTVDKPHIVIANIVVNTERNQSLTDVIERMKREAAVLGGDAITNIRTNAGTGKWAQVKPQKLFGNANIRTNFIADVVVYIPEDGL